MRRKILSSLVAFSMGLMFFAFPLSAEEGKSAESSAEVTFTAGAATPTDPVDPSDPNKPGDGGGTGMNGPLSLDYVPSLGFGIQKISGKVETYESTVMKPFVQVTDNRGSGAGWQVEVSLTNFVGMNTGTELNAAINFKNGSVATTKDNPSGIPTVSDTTLTSGAGAKVLFNTTAVDQGMGTWVARWFATNEEATTNDSITFVTDTRGAKADVYTAKLDWVISNAP